MERRHPTVQQAVSRRSTTSKNVVLKVLGTMLVAHAGSNPTIAKFGDAFEGRLRVRQAGLLIKVDAKHKDLMMKFVNEGCSASKIALIECSKICRISRSSRRTRGTPTCTMTMMRNKVKAARYYEGLLLRVPQVLPPVAHRQDIDAGLLPPAQAQAIAEAIGAASSTQHDDDDDRGRRRRRRVVLMVCEGGCALCVLARVAARLREERRGLRLRVVLRWTRGCVRALGGAATACLFGRWVSSGSD